MFIPIPEIEEIKYLKTKLSSHLRKIGLKIRKIAQEEGSLPSNLTQKTILVDYKYDEIWFSAVIQIGEQQYQVTIPTNKLINVNNLPQIEEKN